MAVRTGLDQVKTAAGYAADYNVFLEGAKPSTFGDRHSVVDPQATKLAIQDHPLGATITFAVNDEPRSCHSEHSEESPFAAEILRCAQDDSSSSGVAESRTVI